VTNLFTLPQHVRDAAALAVRLKIRGHAGQPGAGPAGETCKSCQHYTHNEGRTARDYRKCELSRDQDLPRGVALGAALVAAFLVVLLVTIWRMVR
jgi:hypothetical protein